MGMLPKLGATISETWCVHVCVEVEASKGPSTFHDKTPGTAQFGSNGVHWNMSARIAFYVVVRCFVDASVSAHRFGTSLRRPVEQLTEHQNGAAPLGTLTEVISSLHF